MKFPIQWPNNYCEFCIKDNGIGLDTRYADTIFEPFKRLHAKHEYGGTGMGLAITRKIIESSGGYIRVESKVGEGTSFFFSFPIPKRESACDKTLAEAEMKV